MSKPKKGFAQIRFRHTHKKNTFKSSKTKTIMFATLIST